MVNPVTAADDLVGQAGVDLYDISHAHAGMAAYNHWNC